MPPSPATEDEWVALTIVTATSPRVTVPPLFMPMPPSSPSRAETQVTQS
jgi:hypothetical protein